MEESEWSQVVDDRFDDIDFCFVGEISASQAFDDVDRVRVTFEFWSTRNFTEEQKQKKAQELVPRCNRLIKEYPRCMFAFRYVKRDNDIVVFLESPLIPEPQKPPKPVEYYRGLPIVNSPAADLRSRTYDVPMDKLIELTLCPADQIRTILEHKGVSPKALTYSDFISLVLDYQVVVKYFKNGLPLCIPFSELHDSFDGSIRLIDKIVFFDLYYSTKRKAIYRCYCCQDSGRAIHHINGNHFDMIEENLVFVCNNCHYQLHKDWFESKRGYEITLTDPDDPLAVK